MRRYMSRAIALATLIFVFFIFSSRFAIIKENYLRHGSYFFLVALIYLGGRLLYALMLNMLISHFGLKITKRECFGLSMIVPFYNLILPTAGTLTNAMYLKSKHGFKFKNFISIGMIKLVLRAIVCAVFGIIGTSFYIFSGNPLLPLWAVSIYLLIISICVFSFFIPVPHFLKGHGLFSKVLHVIESFKALKANKKLVLSLFFLQSCIMFLFILRYYVLFRAFSFSPSFLGTTAVIPLTDLSNLVNVIPGNFAIREAVTSGASVLIGYNLKQGLLVAAIDRIVLVTTVLILGTYFFVRLKYVDNIILPKKNVGRVTVDGQE